MEKQKSINYNDKSNSDKVVDAKTMTSAAHLSVKDIDH
jgi:hypothetical protein